MDLTPKIQAYLQHDVLEERCEVHGCQLFGKEKPTPEGRKYLRFCPDCARADIANRTELLARTSQKEAERFMATGMLERVSIIPYELKGATLQNYQCGNRWENDALGFAQKMARHYYEGGEGNVIFVGQPGQGKSHLSLGMLRALNEQFAKEERYKSAVFMPVAKLFHELKRGIGKNVDFVTEERCRLLREAVTTCDFLVLDDLGKESSYSHELKRANDWVQSVLFDILDSRRRTIITTNFSGDQLEQIYDPALVDRIFKGGGELRHRMSDKIASRRH